MIHSERSHNAVVDAHDAGEQSTTSSVAQGI